MLTQQFFRLSLAWTVLCFALPTTTSLADAVRWRTTIDAAKLEAQQTNKLVLLHFWTPNCGPCKQLESDVFSQPQIGQLLEQNFVPVKINADQSPAISASFNIDRVPSDVVLTPQGNVVAKLSCPPAPSGYATQLLNLAQHYRQQLVANKVPAQAPIQSAYAGLRVGEYNKGATVPFQGGQGPSSAYQAPTAASSNPSMTPPPASPQVTYNSFAAPPASPQTGNQEVSAVPDRYQSYPMVAAAPQASPASVQPASAQTVSQSTQQLAASSGSTTQTTNAIASSTIAPIKLPEGSPPLAFEGYCPTTLKHSRKWVLGNPKYGAIHRGRTYLFTSESQRQQFLANPDLYSPVFSGIDPVKLLDENKTVEGSRKFGYEYRDAFYLFSSKESMTRFASQPDLYAAGVRQAMVRMDGGVGSGTIRR